jgi:two-component system, sensor histidine kinase and response regulator
MSKHWKMNGTGRVLVVEDQPSLRQAIRLTLEAEGYAVWVAGDGRQALQAMEEETPDVILADIMMPKMDGYDFYRAVRARPEWTSIPFIFLTAKTQRADVIKGKALGVEAYLTKPVDPEELLVTVHTRLARARAIQANAEANLDKVKRQIVTVLGHEMRTPLTYIRGYTELALEDIPSLSPEVLEEFLQSISQGANRLTRLADDFLTLVRLDAGQTEAEFQQLVEVRRDLGGIVERTVRQYEPQAAAKGLTLECRVKPNLPPVQLCEPLLADALGRLIENAIKFCQAVGKRITVSTRGTLDGLEIAVADEGPGIPPDEIPHLFERFRQIDREKMEQQGVGLGLAVAQGVIQLHGGEITVASTVGEGSTFTIRLPLAEARERAREHA